MGTPSLGHTPANEIVRLGLMHCPERRRPFHEMSVRDNLMAGAYLHFDKGATQADLDKVFQLFPVLQKRLNQVSGTLSGSEQQMLAVGRALMSRPKLLCIDRALHRHCPADAPERSSTRSRRSATAV